MIDSVLDASCWTLPPPVGVPVPSVCAAPGEGDLDGQCHSKTRLYTTRKTPRSRCLLRSRDGPNLSEAYLADLLIQTKMFMSTSTGFCQVANISASGPFI